VCADRLFFLKVSYEYIACQQKRNGVMILSEFAGAAQSLNGSIIVNPWDSQQVADAIFEAVTTSPEVRQENQKKLFKASLTHNLIVINHVLIQRHPSPSAVIAFPFNSILKSTRRHTGELHL